MNIKKTSEAIIYFGRDDAVFYDISVCVCSFEPDWDKLKRTLKSVLLQEGLKVQTVVCDDGSKKFPIDQILEFFEANNYIDFIIYLTKNNHGTVTNIYNGINLCTSDYIKDISPGDYLNTNYFLKQWLDEVKTSQCDFSICDGIYFYIADNNKFVALEERISPQANDNYYHNKWFYNYLIFDDIAVGACMLTKTSVLREYLQLILGKVKYAEDNIFRIMAADKKSMMYFHRSAVLYEIGTGISTSNNSVWQNRLNEDWLASNKIISNRIGINDKELSSNFRKNEKAILMSKYRRAIYKTLFVRGWLINYIRKKIHPRFSSIYVDHDYLSLLGLTCDQVRDR